ncbi:hypothetical protein JCM15579A_17630 [Marinifilum fragile]
MDKMRKVFSGKNILISIGVILFDLFVYLVLGMLLMNYDDFYDESKGEYWSLESMTFWQKANYIGLNLWHIINVIVIGYVIYRVIKMIRKNALQQ